MLAVFSACGKQYIAQEGKVLFLDTVKRDVGELFDISGDVLFACSNGASIDPKSAVVILKLLEHKRGDKVLVFKKKRRKNYRRKMGYRHGISVVRVDRVSLAS